MLLDVVSPRFEDNDCLAGKCIEKNWPCWLINCDDDMFFGSGEQIKHSLYTLCNRFGSMYCISICECVLALNRLIFYYL